MILHLVQIKIGFMGGNDKTNPKNKLNIFF